MVKVYDTYTKEVVYEGADYKDALKWIGGRASKLNYGMCRMWEVEGFRYWDCGPRTYKIAVADIPAEYAMPR